jgi:hypothetical protein
MEHSAAYLARGCGERVVGTTTQPICRQPRDTNEFEQRRLFRRLCLLIAGVCTPGRSCCAVSGPVTMRCHGSLASCRGKSSSTIRARRPQSSWRRRSLLPCVTTGAGCCWCAVWTTKLGTPRRSGRRGRHRRRRAAARSRRGGRHRDRRPRCVRCVHRPRLRDPLGGRAGAPTVHGLLPRHTHCGNHASSAGPRRDQRGCVGRSRTAPQPPVHPAMRLWIGDALDRRPRHVTSATVSPRRPRVPSSRWSGYDSANSRPRVCPIIGDGRRVRRRCRSTAGGRGAGSVRHPPGPP